MLSGEEVRELMHELGIRPKDIIDEIGISKQTLYDIINEKHKTNMVVWYALISYFKKVNIQKSYEKNGHFCFENSAGVLAKLENL